MKDKADMRREQLVDTYVEVDIDMLPTEAVVLPVRLVGPPLVLIILLLRPVKHLLHPSY